MQSTIPEATNIKAENVEATQFSAEIGSKVWSGITESSTFWPSIQAAIDSGVVPEPYVPYEPTIQDQLIQTDQELMAKCARAIEDILDERDKNGKFLSQEIKDLIALRKSFRDQL